MTDPAFHRLEMVRRQLERRGIRDGRVLRAMETVPREAFVPERFRARAFEDGALPLDCGQTISQPYIVAAMCVALALRPEDRVLEVGAGSGYAAAILAELAGEVYALERIDALVESARERLERLGYGRVVLAAGDGSLGWPEHAPYDGILVSAGAPKVPEPLRTQLRVGGRLVIPLGGTRLDQRLYRITRTAEDAWREEPSIGVRFVPLVGAQGWADDEVDAPRQGL